MRTKEAIACGFILFADTEDGDIWTWHMTDEEIVRCRYCINFGEGYCPMYSLYGGDNDGFCAWGVRRDD